METREQTLWDIKTWELTNFQKTFLTLIKKSHTKNSVCRKTAKLIQLSTQNPFDDEQKIILFGWTKSFSSSHTQGGKSQTST